MPAAAPTITLQALTPEHIPLVLEVCTDWRERRLGAETGHHHIP